MVQALPAVSTYIITRRPAVSPRARVISLPSDVVIDATGYGMAYDGVARAVATGRVSAISAYAGRSPVIPAKPSRDLFFEFFDIIFSPQWPGRYELALSRA